MALLTRARIVDQARSIVEADGHEQLSLRGLAAMVLATKVISSRMSCFENLQTARL